MTTPVTSPFASVQSPLSPYLSKVSFTQTQVLEIVFVLIFAVWLIYTLIAIYHWVRYGHRSWAAVPAIVLHIIVSVFLFVFAASGFIG